MARIRELDHTYDELRTARAWHGRERLVSLAVIAFAGGLAVGAFLGVRHGESEVAAPSRPVVAPFRLPDVTGLELAAAQRRLARAGLGVDAATRVVDPDVPEGVVARTLPPPGVDVRDGSKVTLVVSRGARPATVAELVALMEARPALGGAYGPRYAQRLANLANLSGARLRAETADLFGLARAGRNARGFSAELRTAAANVLRPRVGVPEARALIERRPNEVGPAAASLVPALDGLAGLDGPERRAAGDELIARARELAADGQVTPKLQAVVVAIAARS